MKIIYSYNLYIKYVCFYYKTKLTLHYDRIQYKKQLALYIHYVIKTFKNVFGNALYRYWLYLQ